MHDARRPEGGPEDPGYRRAARYEGPWAEHDAARAYQRTRRALYRARRETELSVYRLQIGNLVGDVAYLGWYVALLGDRPDAALAETIEGHLAEGLPVKLPSEVVAMLQARRAASKGIGSWSERKLGRLTNVELYRRPEGEAGQPGNGGGDR